MNKTAQRIVIEKLAERLFYDVHVIIHYVGT